MYSGGGYGAPPPGYTPPPGGFAPPPGGFGYGGGGPPLGPMYSGTPSTGLATAALIVGVLAIPGACCCYSSVPFGIAAIIMGFLALSKAKESPMTHGGRPLAMAGVICGAIGLALTVLVILMGLGMSLANNIAGV